MKLNRKPLKQKAAEKPKKPYYSGDSNEAEIELSVSLTLGSKGKADFKSITVRAGERVPSDLDKLQEAYDAVWDDCRDQLQKRFPQMVKTATRLDDE